MLDLLLPEAGLYLCRWLVIPWNPEFRRNRYSVAVLPAVICMGLAQAKDGFAVDFRMISKHKLVNIK